MDIKTNENLKNLYIFGYNKAWFSDQKHFWIICCHACLFGKERTQRFLCEPKINHHLAAPSSSHGNRFGIWRRTSWFGWKDSLWISILSMPSHIRWWKAKYPKLLVSRVFCGIHMERPNIIPLQFSRVHTFHVEFLHHILRTKRIPLCTCCFIFFFGV